MEDRKTHTALLTEHYFNHRPTETEEEEKSARGVCVCGGVYFFWTAQNKSAESFIE